MVPRREQALAKLQPSNKQELFNLRVRLSFALFYSMPIRLQAKPIPEGYKTVAWSEHGYTWAFSFGHGVISPVGLRSSEAAPLPFTFSKETGHVRCMAHILNLAAQSILKTLKAVGSSVVDDFLGDGRERYNSWAAGPKLESLTGDARTIAKIRRTITKVLNSSKL
jgi:hypothetical protein